jgi:hypothetical protein
LPLAACFVSLSAWGAASGRLPDALRAAAVALGFESPEPSPPSAPARPRGLPGGGEPKPAPELASPPPAPPPPAAPTAPAPPAPVVAREPPPRKAPSAEPAPAASAPDPTHDLYRAAHRAHFVDQNPASALVAWDEYLRAAPNGRFAIEARYNRALCLARLGRGAEARAALEPFAAGKFNGYRQREAMELRAALEPIP